MLKSKWEQAWSPSKNEHQKLQSFYTQGGAAYGSVQILAKASRLTSSKMRQLLHSKRFNKNVFFWPGVNSRE